MSIQSESALLQAYSYIEAGNIHTAKVALENALMAQLDDSGLVFAVYCCSFWENLHEDLHGLDNFEHGETLVSHWKQFTHIIKSMENVSERTVYSFQKYVFSIALDKYSSSNDDNDQFLESEIQRKQGLCYKKLGSYEIALQCLTKANAAYPGRSCVIAEMADCYALCGETKRAKVLFREAFFIESSKIDLEYLDSPLITLLVEQVKAKGYNNEVLKEWIGVYGVLMGIFTVKRELRAREVGHLKQEIYATENLLKDPANNAAVLTPRLINKYFWLIDHYLLSRESVTKINELLLKIKILDPAVYKIYVK